MSTFKSMVVLQILNTMVGPNFSTPGRKSTETILKSLSYHTMLTSPPTFGTSRGVLDLNSSSLVRTRRNGRKLNCLPPWSNVNLQIHGRTSASGHHGRNSTDVIFKILKFSAHLFWTRSHSHSSLISCLGFIMAMVIVISFAHERKLYPMLCIQLLTRIVKSPTKLNDKI